MSKNTTKRSLLASVLALVMCVTMLIGTTFAWFTDSASTSVNKIEAGKLNVELLNKNDQPLAKDHALAWETTDSKVLWEPNCTYNLEQFKIKNAGNLALKYKLILKATTIDKTADGKSLLDVIDWTVTCNGEVLTDAATRIKSDLGNGIAIILDKKLLPDAVDTISVSGHMDANAGNDYQGLTIDGFGVTVSAAQVSHESDSKDNTYDADAKYLTSVGTAAELAAAVKAGENVILKNAITLTSALSVPADSKVSIDLNGSTLSSTVKNTLVVNKGAEVTVSDSGDGTGVIANTYTGSAKAITVDLKENATFTLNSGVVQTNAKDNLYSVAIGNSKKNTCTVNINGGTVTCGENHENSRAISASNGMTVNIYGGTVIGGLYALDVYAGSVSNIYGGTLISNGKDGRTDEYGTTYAVHAKGVATINVGSAALETVPEVKGIKFETSGVKTDLPTINLVKGAITNPIYSLEQKYNYELFKLGITADAPVTFTDDTAHFFLPDGLQMVQSGSVWQVTAK